MIREINPQDYTKLLFLYQESFPIHNIFSRSEKEILEYLDKTEKKNMEKKGGYFVYEFEGNVVGSILIKFQRESENHKVWSINHLAVKKAYRSKGIASELLRHAEEVISKNSKTAKIEIKVSENEKGTIEIYKRLGYKLEGTLRSHYRFNEEVYVLGKVIS